MSGYTTALFNNKEIRSQSDTVCYPPPITQKVTQRITPPPTPTMSKQVGMEDTQADVTAPNATPKGIRGTFVTPASQKTTADPAMITVRNRTGSPTKETSVAETTTEDTKVDIPKEIDTYTA